MKLQTLSLAVLAALALPVSAQEADTLDRAIVTANRMPIAVRDVIAAVEVIDRDDIEASQARSLPDLLRGRAGISIGNQGGLGKLTTLFLRGSESDHVLVLVDGVRIGSATSGLASFQDLPLELIERVEIVRGPRSSLYGSEAIGGVIQVFTRRDAGRPAPRLAIGVGSQESYEASAGIGGRIGRGWFGADYSRTQSRGIDSCRGFFNPATFAGGGCFDNEPDRDGYQRDSISLRGGLQLAPAWTLDAQLLRAEADNEYDGSFVNRSEILQQVVGADLAWRVSPSANLRLGAGRNTDASDNFNDANFAGRFDTDRDTASLQGDFSPAAGHRLSAGFDWLRDSVSSTTRYVQARRGNRALFAQYHGDLGPLDLQASARQDDNDQFGRHATGNIAAGFDLARGWRLSLGAGTAFKAPTFNELYYPFGFGNPGLQPEHARSLEAGLAWKAASGEVRLDAFRTAVDDLIAYDSTSRRPENIERARLAGMELSASARIAGWESRGSLGLVDAENRSAAHDGRQLPRRARTSARLDLDRGFGVLRLGMTAVAEGARHDDLANARRLGGYATLDLRAEYRISSDWRVQARLGNALDRDYETVEYYNQPGRTWFMTFRYAPTR
jgi:vitamin B12 transporter